MPAPTSGSLLTADQAARRVDAATPWELWDGALVVAEPAGGAAGAIGAELAFRLREALGRAGRGRVCDASTGFLVRQDPDRVLSPDVSYVSKARLPSWPTSGFAACVPDLVAEVRSPHDAWTAVVARGGVWIAEGARVVWLVDPIERRVVTLRPGLPPEEVDAAGRFTGAPVVPRLEIGVASLLDAIP